MKIVLTGTTGFIGGEVLRQCLLSPYITSVVALVRRQMPSQNDPKLQQVIMKDDDFLKYPDAVKRDIGDADGCIWALGSPTFPNDEIMRRVSVDYNKVAASEFAALAAASGKTIQFVYVSGALVERDQSRKLWIKEYMRRSRGYGEIVLIEKAAEDPMQIQVTIARPAFVLGRSNMFAPALNPTGMSIKVNELAAAMVECAINGSDKQTLSNAELMMKGRAVLKMQSTK